LRLYFKARFYACGKFEKTNSKDYNWQIYNCQIWLISIILIWQFQLRFIYFIVAA